MYDRPRGLDKVETERLPDRSLNMLAKESLNCIHNCETAGSSFLGQLFDEHVRLDSEV